MSHRNGNGTFAEMEPMRLETCPIHDTLVLISSSSGKHIHRCPGCVDEAEHGLRILAEIAERKRMEGDG